MMNTPFKVRREMVNIPRNIEVENIYVKSSVFKTQNLNKKHGVLYNKSGMLIYTGSDGTLSVIANS